MRIGYSWKWNSMRIWHFKLCNIYADALLIWGTEPCTQTNLSWWILLGWLANPHSFSHPTICWRACHHICFINLGYAKPNICHMGKGLNSYCEWWRHASVGHYYRSRYARVQKWAPWTIAKSTSNFEMTFIRLMFWSN